MLFKIRDASGERKYLITASNLTELTLTLNRSSQPRPQGFSLKKWVGREKALASAGHVSPRTP